MHFCCKKTDFPALLHSNFPLLFSLFIPDSLLTLVSSVRTLNSISTSHFLRKNESHLVNKPSSLSCVRVTLPFHHKRAAALAVLKRLICCTWEQRFFSFPTHGLLHCSLFWAACRKKLFILFIGLLYLAQSQ